jgi:hypothetical protein
MTESVVELSRETAEKVDRILWLLEGDELRPGLISLVQDNSREIERLKRAESQHSTSTSALLGVAWLGVLLAPMLTLMDRMVLISDVRSDLQIYGYTAVLISAGLGLMATGVLIFVVVIFTLRWLGVGRGGAHG